jgi:hypothetical protein
MKKPKVVNYLVPAIFIILIAIVIILLISESKNPYPIDQKIIKKANFVIAVPTDNKVVKKESVVFNQEAGALSYKANYKGTIFNVSEQPTPDIFTENGNVYGYKLDQMRQFQELQTSLGKVTLTKPEELKGKVVAVSNVNGNLMFITADKDLSKSQWQDFYNNLQLIR